MLFSTWLLVAAFFGAGVFNAIGTSGRQSDFARWGYPRWWNIFTGGLEIMSAVLIVLPVSRIVGLTLGAAIIAAAVLTVLRHRDFFAPCATWCLCRLDCSCRDLVLRADIANQTLFTGYANAFEESLPANTQFVFLSKPFTLVITAARD